MSRITKAQHIEAVFQTAIDAISMVGDANYAERETAAKAAVARAVLTGKYVDPGKVLEEKRNVS